MLSPRLPENMDASGSRSRHSPESHAFEGGEAFGPVCRYALSGFEEAKILIEMWRRHDNEVRPQSALGVSTSGP